MHTTNFSFRLKKLKYYAGNVYLHALQEIESLDIQSRGEQMYQAYREEASDCIQKDTVSLDHLVAQAR
ncbi:hypothetical protein KSX_50300 [Ktedonospora formicarum]|uniref:Uncharacterized protein n=1 Tax=Ktedonospora formicarum TaxID=2778364 RepID=A0A8J3I6A2_9CHLR|nr:hypothetical protein KSX_50300 [Ktedonospora formicarum]